MASFAEVLVKKPIIPSNFTGWVYANPSVKHIVAYPDDAEPLELDEPDIHEYVAPYKLRGLYVSDYYADGILVSTTGYCNRGKISRKKNYHTNGVLASKTDYDDSDNVSQETEYNTNGVLISETEYDFRGYLESQTDYDNTGVLASVTKYWKHARESKKLYDDNGALISTLGIWCINEPRCRCESCKMHNCFS